MFYHGHLKLCFILDTSQSLLDYLFDSSDSKPTSESVKLELKLAEINQNLVQDSDSETEPATSANISSSTQVLTADRSSQPITTTVYTFDSRSSYRQALSQPNRIILLVLFFAITCLKIGKRNFFSSFYKN